MGQTGAKQHQLPFERVLLSIFNDLEESKNIRAVNNHTLQTPVKLQMFNNFESGFIDNNFLAQHDDDHVKPRNGRRK